MTTRNEHSASSSSIRRAILVGLFSGTGVGVGFLLSGIPNLELMTLVVALAGATLGRYLGLVAGVLCAAIYSLGSPYGLPMPVLLFAQALGMGTVGFCGGLAGKRILKLKRAGRSLATAAIAATFGALVTLFYDLVTNLAIMVAFDAEPRVVLLGALPLSGIHVLTNGILFMMLIPVLLPRLAGLANTKLRGVRGTSAVVLAMSLTASAPGGAQPVVDTTPAGPDTLATDEGMSALADSTLAMTGSPAAVDSLMASVPDSAQTDRNRADWVRVFENSKPDQQRPAEWKRSLWQPFYYSLPELLEHESLFSVISDGGLGSETVLLNEGATSPSPMVLRDGIPLGTGHRLVDDPWTASLAGLAAGIEYGADDWGGTDGVINLTTRDDDPEHTVTDTHWFKGPHLSYLRRLSLLSPRAPWRYSFDFQENLDNEGYDFRVPEEGRYQTELTRGESKIRSGRGSLQHCLGPESDVGIFLESQRKGKTSLPALQGDRQEVWNDRARLVWRDRTAHGLCRVALFLNDSGMGWDGARKLETGREGLLFEWHTGSYDRNRVRMTVTNWRLNDTGTTSDWADSYTGPISGQGQQATLGMTTKWLRGIQAGEAGVTACWDSYGDWQPFATIKLRQAAARPWWLVFAELGGRAPRSDELLTPMEFAVPERRLYALPNESLYRERTLRAGLKVSRRLAGIDLAISGTIRQLRDGITWTAAEDDPFTGTWTNSLDMFTQQWVGQASYARRFAGWLRLDLQTVLRNYTISKGAGPARAPEQAATLRVLWENHFFQEDGIWQLAYYMTQHGPMLDPWYHAGEYSLPAATRHDVIVSFRLVGTHLGLAFRNITDTRERLTAGALVPGREMQWRLAWIFKD